MAGSVAICLVMLVGSQEMLLPPPWPASERAPHKRGNIYAPELVVEKTRSLLYYGAQGLDGHDRIHLAVSTDGTVWKRHGVVLEDPAANHVNDPSVVVAQGVYHLYYTLAREGVSDVIALATSQDGLHWQKQGVVLNPGQPGAWDNLLVGRPSALFEKGKFRLWYDGRKDLPPGAPDTKAPQSPSSSRAVGLAESTDGKTFSRVGTSPVFSHDSGGVHVVNTGQGYAMVIEGTTGTRWASSTDGLVWSDRGQLAGLTGGPWDRHGHVTPFLVTGDKPCLLVGGATAPTWDANRILRLPLAKKSLEPK
ncbi:MAG: hypothetical protein NTV55_08900 [Planctomycetota bacterium]|nr:hypothetical protein [Planctomycetota bacterium]